MIIYMHVCSGSVMQVVVHYYGRVLIILLCLDSTWFIVAVVNHEG